MWPPLERTEWHGLATEPHDEASKGGIREQGRGLGVLGPRPGQPLTTPPRAGQQGKKGEGSSSDSQARLPGCRVAVCWGLLGVLQSGDALGELL